MENNGSSFWSAMTGCAAEAWNASHFAKAGEIAKSYNLTSVGLDAAGRYTATKFAVVGVIAGASINGMVGASNALFANAIGFLSGSVGGPQVGVAAGSAAQYLLDKISEATYEIGLGSKIYDLEMMLKEPRFWSDIENFFLGIGDSVEEGIANAATQLGNMFLDFFAPDGLKPSDRNGPLTFGFGSAGFDPTINITTHSCFQDAQNWTPRRIDPLALDLDGDGIETTGIGGWGTVLFDHNVDGRRTGTGWLSADDGWLVRDLNGNGTIDNGSELFGDNTTLSDGTQAADGFAALADLDSNGDGVIDASDAAFGELKVWQDLNQDGISQAGELKTLSELGITALSTGATANGQVQNGNTVTATAGFTRADGSRGSLNLATSNFLTKYTDTTTGDNTLPEMHRSGAESNLQDELLLQAA